MLRRVGKSDRSRGLAAKRWLCCSVSPMVLIAIFSLAAARPAAAQTAAPTATPPDQLKQIDVTAPKRKPARRAAPGTQPAPLPAPAPTAGNGKGPNTTPLNTNVIAESASRLGLTVARNAGDGRGHRSADDARAGLSDHRRNREWRGGRIVRRCGRRARRILHAGLQLRRSECSVQWDFDRPTEHHVALDGHGQSRAGRVPERPFLVDDGSERHRRVCELRHQAADKRADPERTGPLARFARHGSFAFRLRRQHGGERSRLSVRRDRDETERIHRRC